METVSVMIPEEELLARVRAMAAQITADYEGKEIKLICILKGSVFFTTELAKRIDLPVKLDFMSVSSYGAGTTSSGKRAYSSYFELTAPFRLGGLDWEATFGAVPYQTSFYDTNGFAVTNISLKATKDFVIKQKWHLPVFAGLTGNPRAEKLYFIFGTSFSI